MHSQVRIWPLLTSSAATGFLKYSQKPRVAPAFDLVSCRTRLVGQELPVADCLRDYLYTAFELANTNFFSSHFHRRT